MKKLLIPLLLFISVSVSAQYRALIEKDTASLVGTKHDLSLKRNTATKITVNDLDTAALQAFDPTTKLNISDTAAMLSPYPKTSVVGRLLASSNVKSSAGADTNEDTLYAVTIPASSIGVNGSLHIIPLFSCTNSAGSKTFRIYINGTKIAEDGFTTVGTIRWYFTISNRNSASSQVMGGIGSGAAESFGSSGLSVATYSFNTAANMRITVTAQKNTTGDAASLESFQIIGYY